MKVTITEQCGRCKRTAPLEVELAEAQAIESKQGARQHVIDDIRKHFDEMNKPDMPDLVVYFKGQVLITDKVCDTYCAETIKATLDKVLFRPIDPTNRKPREKKSEKTPDSPVKEKKPSASSKKGAAAE